MRIKRLSYILLQNFHGFNFDYKLFAALPLWRNSGGRRRFRVTIGRLVVGSIPGRDLRERNFGGAQNNTKEWCG